MPYESRRCRWRAGVGRISTKVIYIQLRNATLLALEDTVCYTLDKKTFDELLGAFFVKSDQEKNAFFVSTFGKMLSAHNLIYFQKMFSRERIPRGQVLTRKGGRCEKMYLIETGEVGVTSEEQKVSRHVSQLGHDLGSYKLVGQPSSQVSVVGRSGIIGDEWYCTARPVYQHTTIALNEPTMVYAMHSSKFENMRLILGQNFMKSLVDSGLVGIC